MSPLVDRNAPDVTISLPPQPVTAEEREWLRNRHHADPTPDEHGRSNECLGCGYPFPCPTSKVLDALEAAERRESALVAREDAVVRSITALVEHVSGSCVGDRVQRAIWMMPAKWLHDAAVSQAAYNAITAAVAAHDARRKEAAR